MTRTKVLLVLKSISWIGMIVLFIVISIVALDKRAEVRCQNLKIRFKNDENLGFIGSREVLHEVNMADPFWKGQKLSQVKFSIIENGVRQNEYIKKSELFIDNQENINVLLVPKKPIARVHGADEDYYLSEDWDRMSLSNKFSSRIVYVSGRVQRLVQPESKLDSFICHSVRRVLNYCDENPVWKDAVEQIYVNENGKLDIVLSFCEPIVKLGYVDESFEGRMNKVNNFFKAVVRCHSLSKYEELDFQYNQQVVARMKYGIN